MAGVRVQRLGLRRLSLILRERWAVILIGLEVAFAIGCVITA
jgi:hypothetical protein